jgi:ribonuclease J
MTGSERLVGEAFRTLMPLRKGRILVVSFASNVHRMQQAIDVAIQVGRKVAIVGARCARTSTSPRARLPRRAGAHADQAAGGDGAAARAR